MVTFVLNKENADRLVDALRQAALEDPDIDDLADYVHAQSWNAEVGYDKEMMEELIEYAEIYKDAGLDDETVRYYEAMGDFLRSLTVEF